MKNFFKSIVVRRFLDFIFSPLTLIAGYWFRYIRTTDVHKMPISYSIFLKTGVMPVSDHYYEPMMNPYKHLSSPLTKDRNLPGVDLNVAGQLNLLEKFNYNEELKAFPIERKGADDFSFCYNNGSFCSGDAEVYYNIIRYKKPRRIYEIGSGNSTLVAQLAIKANAAENSTYACDHICVEPYEWPALEKLDVKVIRQRVEKLEPSFFMTLNSNDILFIDSSHVIRPQGDVLFEFLELLPQLKAGVIVHIHDIFTPKDYPEEWIYNRRIFWNEQYLLEAYLSGNSPYEIMIAMNYLKHHHFEKVAAKCPVLAVQPEREPGSFWMVKKS